MDLLEIISYEDPQRSRCHDSFKVYINPERLKISTRNQYGKMFPLSSRNLSTSFSCGGPNYLELSLVLDGSGLLAVDNDESVDVVSQLSKLMNNTMEYIGDIHQPPYLKVVWGQLPIFYGRAEHCEVDYKTFNAKGVPVRADVNLMLLEDVEDNFDRRKANPSSPDLYHTHTVGGRDTLPYISFLYYRNPNYSRKIARANKLDNLYRLSIGQQLLIPPLDEAGNL